jgi:hypothetical protein
MGERKSCRLRQQYSTVARCEISSITGHRYSARTAMSYTSEKGNKQQQRIQRASAAIPLDNLPLSARVSHLSC